MLEALAAGAVVVVVASACGPGVQGAPLPAEKTSTRSSAASSSAATATAISEPPTRGPVDEVLNARQVPADDYRDLTWNEGGPLTRGSGSDLVTFDTPSGNITCSWYLDATTDANLNCDVSQRTSLQPPRPADCPMDAGPGWATNYVRLTPAGAQDGVCTGGIQTPAAGNVLPYGSAVVAADYGCRSDESGVTCVHLPSGRGFFVSRAAFTPF